MAEPNRVARPAGPQESEAPLSPQGAMPPGTHEIVPSGSENPTPVVIPTMVPLGVFPHG